MVNTDDCWLYAEHVNNWGYAIKTFNFPNSKQVTVSVHRLMYELNKGEIPKGYEIDHLCRTRICINPAHLEAVTHRENMLRGESAQAVNARKTHCKRGHEFTPDNIVWDKRGHWRKCKACKKQFGY